MSQVDRKVKPEEQPSPLKLKTDEAESHSEILLLKSLLNQKTEESSRREKDIQRLKIKRAKDATKLAADERKIASLEAELARMKRLVEQQEDWESIPDPESIPDSESIPGSSSKKRKPAPEVISLLDSDSEDQGYFSPQPAQKIVSIRVEDNGPGSIAPEDAPNGQSAPPTPTRNQPPPRDAWSPVPNTSTTGTSTRGGSLDVRVKDEVIDVIIKAEPGEEDQFKRVTLIKSEDGRFDIWNVDGFGLGPTIQVDDKFNRGFSRTVISDAFGGGHVACFHNWKMKPGTFPFTTFNRSWNNALPTSPGLHGLGLFSMHNCPVKPQPINFFVGEGQNDWRLLGTYDYLKWGEIAPHHVTLLPPRVLENWVRGTLSTEWGKTWIQDANKDLDDAQKIHTTYDGVKDALRDGRLRIPFTILKCVGFPEDWFGKLEYYEAHPKPKSQKTPKSGKRRAAKPETSPKKKGRTSQKGTRQVKRESSSEEDADWNVDEDSDSDFNGPRPMAGLPVRSSPRKATQT